VELGYLSEGKRISSLPYKQKGKTRFR